MGWLFGLLLKLPGLAEGLLGYLNKRADVGLETHRTNVQADQAVNLALVQAKIEEQKLAAQRYAADRGSLWTAWMMPTAFGLCMIHFGAIVLDSTFKFAWSVDKLPPPYDSIEQSIILAVAGVVGATKVAGRIFSR